MTIIFKNEDKEKALDIYSFDVLRIERDVEKNQGTAGIYSYCLVKAESISGPETVLVKGSMDQCHEIQKEIVLAMCNMFSSFNLIPWQNYVAQQEIFSDHLSQEREWRIFEKIAEYVKELKEKTDEGFNNGEPREGLIQSFYDNLISILEGLLETPAISAGLPPEAAGDEPGTWIRNEVKRCIDGLNQSFLNLSCRPDGSKFDQVYYDLTTESVDRLTSILSEAKEGGMSNE